LSCACYKENGSKLDEQLGLILYRQYETFLSNKVLVVHGYHKFIELSERLVYFVVEKFVLASLSVSANLRRLLGANSRDPVSTSSSSPGLFQALKMVTPYV